MSPNSNLTMQQVKIILLLALMQMVALMLLAQGQDTTSSVINVSLQDNKASFNSLLRPLRQTAGAPAAFYTYFWEFGDGKFSFESEPQHVYKDTGTYDAILYATNNYDDGKPPPRRRKKIPAINKVLYAQQKTPSFFKQKGAIEMKVNRMPRAGEDLVLVIGYRNENKNSPLNGSLVLFYNERQFKAKNFELAEERAYNGEKKSDLNSIAFLQTEIFETRGFPVAAGPNTAEIFKHNYYAGRFSGLLKTKRQQFRQNNVWQFENLQQDEEKYFFLTLHTNPEMIKDTNAVVVLSGMFVPDDPAGEIEEYELELMVVASHDPNRLMLRNRRLNYRFANTKKEMTYKVKFQNTGKGPARQVSVGVRIPSMLDPQSLELIDFYPKTMMCDSVLEERSCLDTIIRKDSVYFIFKDIYLPGLQQHGFSDPDSTMGFVKYRLQFSKKLKKLPFDSKAAIVFDKNDPVHTNGARGYFKPGNSPGIIVGYNKWLNAGDKAGDKENYWMVGATISSYSPYKKYLQWELFVSTFGDSRQLVQNIQNRDTIIDGQPWFLLSRETVEKRKIYNLHLVPLQVRYNIIDLLGAGTGTLISFDAVSKSTFDQRVQVIPQGGNQPVIRESRSSTSKWFSQWDAALFADVQLGKVRVGPALGFRILHYFRTPQNRLLVYATWRL